MTRIMKRTAAILALLLLFFRELVLSGLRVARLVLSPHLADALQPALIDYPISVTSDLAITVLANLITLTPGTLSVDVSADRRLLRLHVLAGSDPGLVIAQIRDGFETAVARVFS